MSEIECPRCHRIDFGEPPLRYSCEECHWPIRPLPIEGKPYGCDVLIEIRTDLISTTTQVRHYKGSESKARSQAKYVPRFIRVLAVVPLSKTAWLNSYGEGKM